MKTLKQIRTELGLSQKAMAVLLGISRNKLAEAEQGSKVLPQKAMDYLEKIEKALSNPAQQEASSKELAFYRVALEQLLQQAESKQKAIVQKLRVLEGVQQSKIVRLHVLDYFAGDFESPNPYPPLMHDAILSQAIDLEEQLLAYDKKLNAVNFEIDGIKAELLHLPN